MHNKINNFWDELEERDEETWELLQRAKFESHKSYCPNTGIQEGAVVKFQDGRLFAGAETQSCVSALQTALASAIRRKGIITDVVIFNGNPDGKFPPIHISRELIEEFKTPDVPVRLIVGNIRGQILSSSLP